MIDRLLGRPAPRPFVATGVHPPAGPPPRVLRFGEVRAALQPLRLARAAPWLLTAPRGDGGLVLDLPGWRTSEAANLPLRTFLRRLGHDVRPWGLGTNTGDPERDAAILAARLRDAGRPVALLGWSLGGTIAREVAREVPELVTTVVTYGSPVVGGPTHTVGAATYGEPECRRVAELIERLDRENPVRTPVTAVVSRRDGVVSWRACIDTTSPSVTHVEVRSTHLGLGLDPDVWWVVAGALAAAARLA